MAGHIGIVACCAEGGALRYRAICIEGAQILGPHDHSGVSMHTHALAESMRRFDRDDWQDGADRMRSSANRMAGFHGVMRQMATNGCDAVCTAIPLIMNDQNSPLPTLDSTRLLARAALRRATEKVPA